jgi:hypothetical protein
MVEILLKGISFDAIYLCSEMFSEIDQNRPVAEDQRQRMVLHFDNASLHTARETPLS